MVWSAATSATYTANTATSGVLAVSDGNGHTENFNLINYTGSGTFLVQSDGNGGTLVFDPPSSSAAVETPSFVFVDEETSPSHFDGAPRFNFAVNSPGQAAAEHHFDRLNDPSLDSRSIALTESHFAFDQAKSSPAWSSQASKLFHEGAAGLGNGAVQEVAQMWGHAGGDSFQFKPELGTGNFDGSEFADSIKPSTTGKDTELKPIANWMDLNILTDPTHHENAVATGSLHPTDHSSTYHLWA